MAENTNDSAVLETEEELTSYTTETNAGAGTGTSARPMHLAARKRARVAAGPPPGALMYVTYVPLRPQRRTMWKRSCQS